MTPDAVLYGMLSAAPGLGRAGAKKLLEAAGSVDGLWKSLPEELSVRAEWPLNRLGFLSNAAELQDQVSRDLELSAAEGVRVLCPADAEYPAGFWDLADPPLLLFVRGRVPVPGRTVAMVGTRMPSSAGTRNANDLAYAWASLGFGIVSGLARGVDAAAHQGALDAGGWTIALLGGGVLTHYPPENLRLQDRIAREGTLISEYGLRVDPMSHHFPERNRLIAALSRAVVVVEAPQKSGALITADFALELGREVLAVPGDIRLAQAKGSNALIRQGAAPVFAPEDLIGHMGWTDALQSPSTPENGVDDSSDLMDTDRLILDEVEKDVVVSTEDLCARLGMTASDILAGLSRLEMGGRLRALSGSRWEAPRAVRT